jgi:phosphomannomutase/phosphoglucomutase
MLNITMKSSLPGYLEYGKTYDEQAATEPQESTQVNPVRLSKTRALLLIVTLFLLAELAFLVFQLMCNYPVASHYVAGVIEQETNTATEQYTTRLTDMVDKYNVIATRLAEDPKTEKLFIAGDKAAMRAREKSLRREFPNALNVQLLPPGLASVNLDASPPLSYAALDQMRLAEYSAQSPPMEVHLFNSPQQHINIVHRVMDPANSRVVGHIMLSLPHNILQGIFDDLGYVQGYIELQQAGARGDPILLAAQGDTYDRIGDAVRVFPIDGSRWQIAYWAPASSLVYLSSISVWVLGTVFLIASASMFLIIALFHRLIDDSLPTTDSAAAFQ